MSCPRRSSRIVTLVLYAAVGAMAACGGDAPPTGPRAPAFAPLQAFDGFHGTFDEQYPYFTYKGIDWAAARDSFRPRAGQVDDVDQLVGVLEEMVEPLRDLHVKFLDPSGATRHTYLPSRFVNWHRDRWQESVLPAGWVQRGPDWGTARFGDVGYLFIGSWNPRTIGIEEVDTALEELRETRALILDVRPNGGGDNSLAFDVAGRFAAEPVLAFQVRYRDGPDHDDLAEPIESHLEPRGPWQYVRPVVVLAGRGCYSSNEGFVSAMRELEQVTVMGDTTGGSSGNPGVHALGGGWSYTVPRWIAYTADGRIIEWQGIPPDVPLDLGPEDFTGPGDPVLDFALRWIREETSAVSIAR